MGNNLPQISCVIIGLNCERTLGICLESAKQVDYPNLAEIIYVDGGSHDLSVEIAKSFNDVKVIELNLKKPTPGAGRNAGWRAAISEWVHFFDSDTIIDKNWLQEAVKQIDARVGAVFGLTKELEPRSSPFRLIFDLELTMVAVFAKFFSGAVLIRRTCLEETGGYDETLIAGEDPELSVRLKNKGWNIIGRNVLMCHHDSGIDSLAKYFKRAYRSGYCYAEAGLKMLEFGECDYFFKMLRIFLKATLVVLLFITGIFIKLHLWFFLVAIGVYLSPFLKIFQFMKNFKISFREAVVYVIHCLVSLWPLFFGICGYFLEILLLKKGR